MKVLSLGWGIQSFTLAAMAALGEIEKPDILIHSDTKYERASTYEFANKWTGWLTSRGIKVITVSNSQSLHDLTSYRTDLPLFTNNKDGSFGQMHRQCTGHWKIEPIRKAVRSELERLKLKKMPGVVTQLIGISLDEFRRMRQSDVRYIENKYPLIELRMTRHDCTRWLTDHNLEIPPRSSCVFCPYHSNSEWRLVKDTEDDWKQAVLVDNAIRDVRPPYSLYIHQSRIPLESVDLRSDEEKGQLSLWDTECIGICGV